MNPKTLIVDDDSNFAALLQMVLRPVGYRCVYVPLVADAIRRLPRLKPSLIITDLSNGPRPGFDLIRAAKKHDRSVPVLVVSGSLNAKNRRRAMRCGADWCSRKPFDVHDLRQTVERLLGAPSKPDRRPVTYQLHIRLSRDTTITIGRSGRFRFPAGQYVYTGSARRNIEARIQRHRSTIKRLHWHIDYLLADPAARIIGVRRFRARECEVNQRVRGRIVVPGFGASDCGAGCGAHLMKL